MVEGQSACLRGESAPTPRPVQKHPIKLRLRKLGYPVIASGPDPQLQSRKVGPADEGACRGDWCAWSPLPPSPSPPGARTATRLARPSRERRGRERRDPRQQGGVPTIVGDSAGPHPCRAPGPRGWLVLLRERMTSLSSWGTWLGRCAVGGRRRCDHGGMTNGGRCVRSGSVSSWPSLRPEPDRRRITPRPRRQRRGKAMVAQPRPPRRRAHR